MRFVRRWAGNGGIEAALAAVFTLITLLGVVDSPEHWMHGVLDVLAFAALVGTLRWPTAGTVFTSALLMTSLWTEPIGWGSAPYIALASIALLVHRARLAQAAVLSAVTFAVMMLISVVRARPQSVALTAAAIFGSMTAPAWLLGAGLRWIASLEAQRVAHESPRVSFAQRSTSTTSSAAP